MGSSEGCSWFAALRGCPGVALGLGAQGCAAPSPPIHGPSSRAGECLSQRGRVLSLGCLCGFSFQFGSVRCPAMGRAAPDPLQPVAPSHQLGMGARAYCSCCQAGSLDPISQWGKQTQRSLFFLQQASNKELFAPNISQRCKNPDALQKVFKYIFGKDFKKVFILHSLFVPTGSPKAAPTGLQTLPH